MVAVDEVLILVEADELVKIAKQIDGLMKDLRGVVSELEAVGIDLLRLTLAGLGEEEDGGPGHEAACSC